RASRGPFRRMLRLRWSRGCRRSRRASQSDPDRARWGSSSGRNGPGSSSVTPNFGIDDIEHLFDTGRPMASLSPDVSAALASLQTRWGAAAPRVMGALATAPLPVEPPDDPSELAPPPAGEPRTGVERVVRTGFPDLDTIVGPGGLGLPRNACVTLKGAPSSGA